MDPNIQPILTVSIEINNVETETFYFTNLNELNIKITNFFENYNLTDAIVQNRVRHRIMVTFNKLTSDSSITKKQQRLINAKKEAKNERTIPVKKNLKKNTDPNLINKAKIFDKILKRGFFSVLKDQNFTNSKMSKNYVKQIPKINDRFIKWNPHMISGKTCTDLYPTTLNEVLIQRRVTQCKKPHFSSIQFEQNSEFFQSNNEKMPKNLNSKSPNLFDRKNKDEHKFNLTSNNLTQKNDKFEININSRPPSLKNFEFLLKNQSGPALQSKKATNKSIEIVFNRPIISDLNQPTFSIPTKKNVVIENAFNKSFVDNLSTNLEETNKKTFFEKSPDLKKSIIENCQNFQNVHISKNYSKRNSTLESKNEKNCVFNQFLNNKNYTKADQSITKSIFDMLDGLKIGLISQKNLNISKLSVFYLKKLQSIITIIYAGNGVVFYDFKDFQKMIKTMNVDLMTQS